MKRLQALLTPSSVSATDWPACKGITTKPSTKLSDGNGSVVRQAEMLKGMSLTPKKRISPRLLPKDTIQEETEEENDNIQ